MPAQNDPESRPAIRLTRDAQGRIIRRTLELGERAETRCYVYDSAGRLARVTDQSGALCESFQYDAPSSATGGRRLAEINPGRFPGERRCTYSRAGRLLAAGSAQFGHDAAGFRNRKVEASSSNPRETRYFYEPSGLLLAVELPGDLPGDLAGGKRIEYAYDSAGMRREKRVAGRLVEAFRWRDPLRLEEFYDGSLWWRLAYAKQGGRTPVGVTNGSESYIILADQLGTPRALATLDGDVVQTMRYDSFGNRLGVAGRAVRLPLGFAGGLYDADTGLTRFVWREYDADTGRFTALDPLGAHGGDPDWYGYCVGDPVNRVDRWGLWSLFGVEFGGDGRSWWQPKYGNWGGQDWSGGQNPKQNDGEDGPAPPVDSSDEIYKRHDQGKGRCDNEDILANDPNTWRRDCNSEVDKTLVYDLKKLPVDPKNWDRPPPQGQEDRATRFKKGAIWWFE